ncbi:hypothetical protein AWV80_38670 [Cupriavidus sp. UYMU48A]|nr:hypothetical protein AWV80_38670 [Cupriavidus sp. UYMU48A]
MIDHNQRVIVLCNDFESRLAIARTVLLLSLLAVDVLLSRRCRSRLGRSRKKLYVDRIAARRLRLLD